jgi:hypothetical protein
MAATLMRYLVTARVKPGCEEALNRAIDEGSLGRGSVAGDEYLRNMDTARALDKVQDAHARSRCRDLNGTEPWACSDCDCTARLEAHLERKGRKFRP